MKMDNKSYIIGIDTGGTYTDAVLIRRPDNTVIVTSKYPTTHNNLSLGISKCLLQLFSQSAVRPAEVELVAVSTTLATNAVVEGKGADVGLLVAGRAKPFRLPVVSTTFLRGGHNHLGEEEEPLDMAGLVDAVQRYKTHVDVYAVCAAMSIVNPNHEKVMAKAISLIDPKPVFCSHEVSDRPGIMERAATSVLNARLMPVMQEFLTGMQDALASLGIIGKVYIIRGDAQPMEISNTHKQAASTVASGPAATAWYGLSFSPAPDALIVDVGGTTTDITLIKDGRPVIDEQGSLIGEWLTHVDAVKMSTVGAGGDSHASVSERGKLTVGPVRVLPLAMSDQTPAPSGWIGKGLLDRCLMAGPDITPEEAAQDKVLAYLVEHGPATPQVLKDHFDMAEITLLSHLKELAKLQLIVETGFTPTDALHVLGQLELGDRQRAVDGAERLAAALGIDVEEFCRQVLAGVEQRIEDAILDHILKLETGKTMSGFFPNYRQSGLFDLRFVAKVPIVGIGAAARYLLPGIAARLGTKVFFPEYYEVGNALGAALMAVAGV
ncbi:MAG: hydantoinase/oxoprolinase family protein [Proteobacteria bacterium]|nr:hydantoinase/oxoprolinase family protein [Pseudomonadota bacterium]MBU4297978.1 hydantoinase/oxoprolinase family protein [Pseudomonadota bacterium]MCG2749538.1 hydantoinase/oxoprolinase family protein [Desulfobulbaceae bacterium]